ncbi:hypothetical protein JCM10212_003885 [Sporobolomyces blumeae]
MPWPATRADLERYKLFSSTVLRRNRTIRVDLGPESPPAFSLRTFVVSASSPSTTQRPSRPSRDTVYTLHLFDDDSPSSLERSRLRLVSGFSVTICPFETVGEGLVSLMVTGTGVSRLGEGAEADKPEREWILAFTDDDEREEWIDCLTVLIKQVDKSMCLSPGPPIPDAGSRDKVEEDEVVDPDLRSLPTSLSAPATTTSLELANAQLSSRRGALEAATNVSLPPSPPSSSNEVGNLGLVHSLAPRYPPPRRPLPPLPPLFELHGLSTAPALRESQSSTPAAESTTVSAFSTPDAPSSLSSLSSRSLSASKFPPPPPRALHRPQ